jgi:mannose-1-phosphate guanylyltransferase
MRRCGASWPTPATVWSTMNIVIMAGGGGTRLWPVSREKLPKQFTRLFGKKTLLQLTFERALRVAHDPARIVVTTRAPYVPEIRRQLPRVARRNILVEPIKRDTAPSIGMAAAFLASRGAHDEPMVLMPSDHAIEQGTLFTEAMREAAAHVKEQPGSTVLLGSWPTYPETGLGYIELGKKPARGSPMRAQPVKRFREKPPLAAAKRFLASGRFVWNMGVYTWRTQTLLELFHTHAPAIAKRLDVLQELFEHGASDRRIASVYRTMPSISLDFAITEKQRPQSIMVIPGSYGWSDIGHWGALQELLGGREGVELKRGAVVPIHATGNFVYNDANLLIGLAGVKDLVIVSTEDALLICGQHHVQDVKKLVRELERRGHRHVL